MSECVVSTFSLHRWLCAVFWEGGENEKVEDDDKNMSQRGVLIDLNQGPEEMDAYIHDDVFKEKVETVAEENIEVKPEKGELSDFDLNKEGGVVDSSNDGDVKAEEDKEIAHEGLSKMETEKGEETVNDSVESEEVAENVVENTEEAVPASENKQEEPGSLIDGIYHQMELPCELNKECEPFSDNDAEKMEVEPYDEAAEEKNEDVAEKVEVVDEEKEKEKMNNEENDVETSSPVKEGLLRGPLDFDLDLNQVPSMEDD